LRRKRATETRRTRSNKNTSVLSESSWFVKGIALPNLQFARRECHRAEGWRAEASGIDAYRSIKLIGGRASGRETPNRSAQRRHVREADRQIERDHRFLSRGERQTKREVSGRRVAAFQAEVRIDGAERE